MSWANASKSEGRTTALLALALALCFLVRCLLLVTVGSFTMPYFLGVLLSGWRAVLMLVLFGFSLELLLHLTVVGR